MRIHKTAVYILAATQVFSLAPRSRAQAPRAQAPRAQAPRAGGPSQIAPQVDATLAQLMRGILYPASNIVAAQGDNRAAFPPAKDASAATDLLASSRSEEHTSE